MRKKPRTTGPARRFGVGPVAAPLILASHVPDLAFVVVPRHEPRPSRDEGAHRAHPSVSAAPPQGLWGLAHGGTGLHATARSVVGNSARPIA